MSTKKLLVLMVVLLIALTACSNTPVMGEVEDKPTLLDMEQSLDKWVSAGTIYTAWFYGGGNEYYVEFYNDRIGSVCSYGDDIVIYKRGDKSLHINTEREDVIYGDDINEIECFKTAVEYAKSGNGVFQSMYNTEDKENSVMAIDINGYDNIKKMYQNDIMVDILKGELESYYLGDDISLRFVIINNINEGIVEMAIQVYGGTETKELEAVGVYNYRFMNKYFLVDEFSLEEVYNCTEDHDIVEATNSLIVDLYNKTQALFTLLGDNNG